MLQTLKAEAVTVRRTQSPILCLRGGGADRNRKEARRKKFAPHMNGAPESQPTGVQGADPGFPPKTESKIVALPPQASEHPDAVDTKRVCNDVRVDGNPGSSNEISNDITKPQRFIVFIGT